MSDYRRRIAHLADELGISTLYACARDGTVTSLPPRQIYAVVDNLLSMLLFCPLVVLFCYSTDCLLNVFVYEGAPLVGPWFVLLLGMAIEFSCSFFQQRLSLIIPAGRPYDVQNVVATRCFNYLVAVGNVCHFRGLQDVFVITQGTGVQAAVSAMLTGLIGLWGMRAARNSLGIPFYVATDRVDFKQFYKMDTVFRHQPDCSLDSFLDHVTTVCVMQSLVHLHWVGTWLVLDLFTLPTIPLASAALCLFLGYTSTTVFLVSQTKSRSISRGFDSQSVYKKLAFENVYFFFACVACILSYKGLWTTCEIAMYFFPIFYKGFNVTAFIAHGCSFVLLSLAHVSNMVAAKSVERDGDFSDGEGVLFCTDYFRELIGDVDSVWPPSAKQKEDAATKSNGYVAGKDAIRGGKEDEPKHTKETISNNNKTSDEQATVRKRRTRFENDKDDTKSLDNDVDGSRPSLKMDEDAWMSRRASYTETQM